MNGNFSRYKHVSSKHNRLYPSESQAKLNNAALDRMLEFELSILSRRCRQEMTSIRNQQCNIHGSISKSKKKQRKSNQVHTRPEEIDELPEKRGNPVATPLYEVANDKTDLNYYKNQHSKMKVGWIKHRKTHKKTDRNEKNERVLPKTADRTEQRDKIIAVKNDKATISLPFIEKTITVTEMSYKEKPDKTNRTTRYLLIVAQ